MSVRAISRTTTSLLGVLALSVAGTFALAQGAGAAVVKAEVAPNHTAIHVVRALPIELAAGHTHACEIMSTRTVECWGWNLNGQLGHGTTTPALLPVSVRGLTGVRQIALGFAHSCALLEVGTVRCWGWNKFGQLGDGTFASTTLPVPVRGLRGVRQITLGFAHTCALLDSGTVRCWGWNTYGQLGNGSHSNSRLPVAVRGLVGVREISAAYGDTCALLDIGTVRCWGWNSFGQLGDGSAASTRLPVVVRGLSGVTQIAIAYGHSCALLKFQTVRCWGWNHYGQLGDGATVSTRLSVPVRGLSGVRQITDAYGHSCAMLVSGRTKCWGWNGFGQLGTGTRISSKVPIFVKGIGGVVQVAAGDDSTCALLRELIYSCWGWNTDGELGDGNRAIMLTPPYLPYAPTTVKVAFRDKAVLVSWRPPSGHGLSAITRYTVTSSPGRHTCATSGALACIVTGLTNGVAYTFSVAARNSLGAGPPSPSSVKVTPATVPGAPTGVGATRGDGSALVSWTAPRSNGGSAITRYTATSSPGHLTCTTGGHSCTVLGLTNGDAYSFTVTAFNVAGMGSTSSASPSVTPAAVPGQPTGVAAVRGNASAAVSWTAPVSNGGSAITAYSVTAADATAPARGNETCGWLSGPLTCTVSGLTNGDSYTFTVTATSTVGMGLASSASPAVTPATIPGAPNGVAASRGNASAVVTWSAPTSSGGSTITGYAVTAADSTNPANGHETCAWAPGPLTCTVTGLTNGDSYTFKVTATNAVGSGNASTSSSAVTPATVPDAPTAVGATAGDASAVVSWSAPASNGGSTVTGYTVTAADATNSGNGHEICGWTPGPLTCTVTGLTNGDSYTFTVTATNVVGLGNASTSSSAVTPATGPGAPTGVGATPGDASAIVTWSAPSNDGGSTITGYTVTAADSTTPANGNEQCTWATGPLTCTVMGLMNGDSYTFTVTATNGVSTSTASTPSSAVTPATVPDAPTGVGATPGDASAAVTWSAPASDGGSTITGYTVTAADSTTPSNGNESCAWSSGPLSCTVTALTNGDSYTFTVTATNGVGTGNPSGPSSSVTPATVPDAPTGVVASPGSASAAVTWSAPLNDGGSTITGYTVTAADLTNPANGHETCVWTPGPLTCTVLGLTTGDLYTFTVTATNGVGTGQPSQPSTSVIALIAHGPDAHLAGQLSLRVIALHDVAYASVVITGR